MAQSLAAGPQPRIVDRNMWLACAAPKSGRLPAVGLLVYYFPYGHAEQYPPLSRSHYPVATSTFARWSPSASPPTPTPTSPTPPSPSDQDHQVPTPESRTQPLLPVPAPYDPGQHQPQIHFYVKTLKHSDADYRDPFAAPMVDANHVFPPLVDGLNDTQELVVSNLQGIPMEFKYGRKGRRLTPTNGWRRFQDQTDFVEDDNVIFMSHPVGDKVFAGVRRQRTVHNKVLRTPRTNPTTAVAIQEVVDAARLAANGAAFTVTYHSRQDGDEFVVPREVVDEALGARLTAGMVVEFVWAVEEGAPPIVGPQGNVVDILPTRVWRNLEVGSPEEAEMNQSANFWLVRPVGEHDLPSSPPPHPQKKLKSSETATTSSGGVRTMAERLDPLLSD